MSKTIELIDRYKGALVGLAVGDAFGASYEFSAPGTFKVSKEMTGGGPFNLKPGYWTDDTSMALCLAESLIECGEFNADDQLRRYLRWYRLGYLSSTGRCFDIGLTTKKALERYEQIPKSNINFHKQSAAGNGCLMRLAPVPLFYARRTYEAIYYSGESAYVTHFNFTCASACKYFAVLMIGILNGLPKKRILESFYTPIDGFWEYEHLGTEIVNIADGSFKEKKPPEICNNGYVVNTLETALWAFYHTQRFEDGLLAIAELGEDSDTVGAVYGQLAGAYYGINGIPERWLNTLHQREMIEDFAVRLYQKRPDIKQPRLFFGDFEQLYNSDFTTL